MSKPRQLALLCFTAGALILIFQVIFRTSGEQLASYELTRTANEVQFESEYFRWPQGIQRAELFLVVDRNKAFEHQYPYQNPTIYIVDGERNTVFREKTSELQRKGRMSGRTIFFTAGVVDLNGSNDYRAIATLSDELVSPQKVEVHLELRQLRVPGPPPYYCRVRIFGNRNRRIAANSTKITGWEFEPKAFQEPGFGPVAVCETVSA